MSQGLFVCKQLNGFKYSDPTPIIILNLNYLFAHSSLVSSIALIVLSNIDNNPK